MHLTTGWVGRGGKFLKKLRRCVGGVGSVDVSSVSISLWGDGSSQVWQVFISNIRECLILSHLPSLDLEGSPHLYQSLIRIYDVITRIDSKNDQEF